MVCSFVSIYFESPQIGNTIKGNYRKRYTTDPEIFDFLEDCFETVSPPQQVCEFS